MSTHEPPIAVLGTVWTELEQLALPKTGFLDWPPEVLAAQPLRFLDWTVDGKPLRDRLAFANGRQCEDITFLMVGNEGDVYTSASLISLLGGGVPGSDPWVQFSDGRAALFFCPVCFGLGCGAVSTDVVITESTVEWRDVAYQDGVTEAISDGEVPSFSVLFDRRQYEATVQLLLERWGQQQDS